MNKLELIDRIRDIVVRVASEKEDSAETSPPHVEAGSRLLGGELPIDSLDLATIVIELQQLTGKDPFANGFINFQTVSELAELYAE